MLGPAGTDWGVRGARGVFCVVSLTVHLPLRRSKGSPAAGVWSSLGPPARLMGTRCHSSTGVCMVLIAIKHAWRRPRNAQRRASLVAGVRQWWDAHGRSEVTCELLREWSHSEGTPRHC